MHSFSVFFVFTVILHYYPEYNIDEIVKSALYYIEYSFANIQTLILHTFENNTST